MTDIKITPSPYGTWDYIPAGGMALTADEFADFLNVIWEGRGDYSSRDRLREKFPTREHDEARLQRNPETLARIESALASTDGDTEVTGQDFLDAMPTEPDCWDVCEGHPASAEPAEEETTANPKIVTLCGSMRFFDKMLTVATEETAKGHIVIAPFSVVAKEDQGSDFKKMLDELHFRKIDMADEIIVVTDENGYIGESTRREMVYAIQTGKFNGADNVREILSSPVVPAPTETGPWETAEAIPKGVMVVTDRDKRTWKYSSRTDGWMHRSHGATHWVHGYPDACFAPFVAAEEG